MLEIALDCIRRGWYVFPCWPRSKDPMTKHGFKDASNSEEQVKAWWAGKPDANVAIATGASGLCVVDVDHGLSCIDDLDGWLDRHGLYYTYAVRTGRRPEFGIQLYYSGSGLKSTGWRLDDSSGDIRCSTGYVMAAGSIHPDSGEAYEVVASDELKTVPDFVRSLTQRASDPTEVMAVDDATADGWKNWLLVFADGNGLELRDYEKRVTNGWWLGVMCPWAHEHGSGPGAESSTVLGVLDGKLVFECSHGTCKANGRDTAAFKKVMDDLYPEPVEEPTVTLGTGLPKEKPERDWRTLFHSQDDIVNCPPPTFFIEDFLAKQAICALAAPVAQRKSLIALNVARSLITGDPLFGFLPVHNKPRHVLYLCPEMGLISVSERVKKIGLTGHVGQTLFIRSMNLGNLDLLDIPEDALLGSVLVVDTAIRFMKGDENSSSDMQAFSETLFELQRRQGLDGAILVLYHSPKATKDASELTLENCMRGSGELGAAITDAHGTRLQDPNDEYGSASYIRHIKKRDYRGREDFEVKGDETGLLTRDGDGSGKVVLSVNTGFKGNRDGQDEAAREIVRANLDKTIREIVSVLSAMGIKRGRTWVSDTKISLQGTGSKREVCPPPLRETDSGQH